MENKILQTVEYLKNRFEGRTPEIAIILGSGLGILAEEITEKIIVPYKDIPNFPVSTVSGHAGELIFGKLNNVPVLAMNGRVHFYEGYDMPEITYPIRIFAKLGIEKLLVTNAAGGINLDYSAGDFMMISDHINFSGVSPLRGKNMDEFGPRFPDMSTAYNIEMRNCLSKVAKNLNINLREGVYAYLQGPNFETPAEIKALRIMGADAVGMSTVPEVIIANHCGIKTVAISCITNMAAGVLNMPLSHEEVQETANRVKGEFKKLILSFIKEL